MEIQKTKHQMKLEQWRQIVYECRNSGQTVKRWCSENQVNVGTYYRWQKKVWESGTQNMMINPINSDNIPFVEYKPAYAASISSAAAILQVGHVRLEIQNGADAATIENIIRAISQLC